MNLWQTIKSVFGQSTAGESMPAEAKPAQSATLRSRKWNIPLRVK